jgi:ribosomal-protein-alanine N-acetyltransferase
VSAIAPKIRPVESFDLPVLAALHAAAFTAPWDQPWHAQSFADVLAMPGAGARILALDQEPIGFILARVAADEAELLLVGVRPDHRRGGHARTLIAHLIGELAAAGVTRLFLEVAESNPAALALYHALGFTRVGRRRGYYPPPPGSGAPAVDALVLALDLQPKAGLGGAEK